MEVLRSEKGRNGRCSGDSSATELSLERPSSTGMVVRLSKPLKEARWTGTSARSALAPVTDAGQNKNRTVTKYRLIDRKNRRLPADAAGSTPSVGGLRMSPNVKISWLMAKQLPLTLLTSASIRSSA